MPPNGFTAIKDATVNKAIVSLVGVIISIQPPKKTKGTDWVLEITIQDDFTTGVIGMESSIKCRLFRPKPDQFPKINGPGDVALLRNFMLSEWNMRMDACWKVNSGVLVFPASGIPAPEFSEPIQSRSQKLPSFAIFGTKDATLEEQMEVIQLKYASSSLLSQVQQFAATAPPPSTVHDKRSLIKDVEVDKFYDIRAEVVNMYYKDGTVELKVTDYTENESLYLYVDADDDLYSFQHEKSWKGPYGKFTINVILWENNALWARDNLAVGDFVVLRNTRIKLSPMFILEGVLHQDRLRSNQADVHKLYTVSDVRELQARKKEYEKEYEKKHAKKSALDNLQNEPKKSSAKASANKRAERKARKRAQKDQEQKEIQAQAEQWDAERNGLNNNSESHSTFGTLNAHIHSQRGAS
jgi:protection-of-telomeres protein 1